MSRQGIRTREKLDRWSRQQCWRPDYRECVGNAMLIGACAIVLVIAAGILWWPA